MQNLALIMYDWHTEHVIKPGERMDMVRAAVLASGRSSMDSLFPEYVPEPTPEDMMAEDDGGPTEVVSTDSPEDALAFIRSLDGAGSLSFEEMGISLDDDEWSDHDGVS